MVFGEVYAPGFPDSQGDFMTPDEIKKMAYNFLRKGLDVEHRRQPLAEPSGSYVVESFIARDGDPIFIPGSWVLGVKVPDQSVWQMVKSGELNGFSLDGFGVRTPKAFSIEMPELLKGETTVERDHSAPVRREVRPDRAISWAATRTRPPTDMPIRLCGGR